MVGVSNLLKIKMFDVALAVVLAHVRLQDHVPVHDLVVAPALDQGNECLSF